MRDSLHDIPLPLTQPLPEGLTQYAPVVASWHGGHQALHLGKLRSGTASGGGGEVDKESSTPSPALVCVRVTTVENVPCVPDHVALCTTKPSPKPTSTIEEFLESELCELASRR